MENSLIPWPPAYVGRLRIPGGGPRSRYHWLRKLAVHMVCTPTLSWRIRWGKANSRVGGERGFSSACCCRRSAQYGETSIASRVLRTCGGTSIFLRTQVVPLKTLSTACRDVTWYTHARGRLCSYSSLTVSATRACTDLASSVTPSLFEDIY